MLWQDFYLSAFIRDADVPDYDADDADVEWVAREGSRIDPPVSSHTLSLYRLPIELCPDYAYYTREDCFCRLVFAVFLLKLT